MHNRLDEPCLWPERNFLTADVVLSGVVSHNLFSLITDQDGADNAEDFVDSVRQLVKGFKTLAPTDFAKKDVSKPSSRRAYHD